MVAHIAAWSPANDPFTPARFGKEDGRQGGKCKRLSLQKEEFGLEVNPDILDCDGLTRLTDLKGMGLVSYAMDHHMLKAEVVTWYGRSEIRGRFARF